VHRPRECTNIQPKGIVTTLIAANMLLDSRTEMIADGFYQSRSGTGYYANFKGAGKHINVSVSGTTSPVPALEIAAAITSPSRVITRANPYYNRKGYEHFEATLLCDGHHYMLGIQ
jgi:hypothetical protein